MPRHKFAGVSAVKIATVLVQQCTECPHTFTKNDKLFCVLGGQDVPEFGIDRECPLPDLSEGRSTFNGDGTRVRR